MQERQYEFGGRAGGPILASLLGVAFVAFAAYALITGWAIRLYSVYVQPDIARYFYLFFLVLGLVLVVMAIRTLIAGKRQIIVTPTSITMPKGEGSRTMLTVNAADIRSLNLVSYNNVRTVQIATAHGTTKLPSSNFASQHEFDDFLATLQSITPAP